MKKPCILLTSVGSRAAEGIMACLTPVRSQVKLVATNSIPEAPGLFDADVAYLVPQTADSPAFEETLYEIVTREEPQLVINGRDEEIEILSRLLPKTPSTPDFLGPYENICEIFNDKYQSAQFAKEHNLPFAPTAFTDDEAGALAAESGFPLIAKPRRGGFAGRDVFILTDETHLQAVLANGTFIVQNFLYEGDRQELISQAKSAFGIHWTWIPRNTYHMIDLVIGRNGSVVSVVVSKAVREGSIVKSLEIIDDGELQEIAERHADVFSASGHLGPVNVQGFRPQDGQFVAFEWNGRFGGSAPGLAYLGVNQVLMAVMDRFPQLQPAPVCEPGTRKVFRPLVYKAALRSDIETLRTKGRWQA